MKSFTEIQRQIISGKFEFSAHGFKRAVERNISALEIMTTGNSIKVIENYPDDKYAPSCLLLGFTDLDRPLHIQVSLIDTEYLKIITIYEPDKNEWNDDFSQRREL